MNTDTANTRDLVEISFIYDDVRVQAHMEATPEQFRLLRDFEIARKPMDAPAAFQVLNIEREENPGSAVELITTIRDALPHTLEEGEEEKTTWDAVEALAGQVDAVAVFGAPSTKAVLVEFIWANGGGDDNLFTQGFVADVANPENAALLTRFSEALEAAGEDDFYDFAVVTDEQKPTLSELRDWLSDNEDEDLDGLRTVLDQVAAADVAAEPARKSPRP